MTRSLALIAAIILCLTTNAALAMIDIAWSPAQIGAAQVSRAAMLLPVRISGCAISPRAGLYMQFDTGQNRTVIYRSGLEALSRLCGGVGRNAVTQDVVDLKLHVDELLLDRTWIVYGQSGSNKKVANSSQQPILLGSLGIDAIASAFVIIDGRRSTFVATKTRAKFTGATRKLLFHPLSLDASGRILVRTNIQGVEQPLTLLLDTGAASQNVVVKDSVFSALTQSNALLDSDTVFSLGGWGKTFECRRKKSTSEMFALGNALLSRDVTSCQTAENQSLPSDAYDGVLGLSGFGRGFLLAVNPIDKSIALLTRDFELIHRVGRSSAKSSLR